MSEHSLIFGLGVRVFFNGIPCWLVGYGIWSEKIVHFMDEIFFKTDISIPVIGEW